MKFYVQTRVGRRAKDVWVDREIFDNESKAKDAMRRYVDECKLETRVVERVDVVLAYCKDPKALKAI